MTTLLYSPSIISRYTSTTHSLTHYIIFFLIVFRWLAKKKIEENNQKNIFFKISFSGSLKALFQMKGSETLRNWKDLINIYLCVPILRRKCARIYTQRTHNWDQMKIIENALKSLNAQYNVLIECIVAIDHEFTSPRATFHVSFCIYTVQYPRI